MTLLRPIAVAMLGVLLAVCHASAASAFCGTITYSARGLSDAEALTKVNNRGLVDVRRLNSQYGTRITYQPATHSCTGGSHVTCTITQQYCVAEAKLSARDDCPGDSVRNAQGKCVKEREPQVSINRCSGGRLFSLSRQSCHCPEALPVWTGSRCISAKPVAGPTNNQIIQRCNLLDRECKSGLQGACRALPQYCERG